MTNLRVNQSHRMAGSVAPGVEKAVRARERADVSDRISQSAVDLIIYVNVVRHTRLQIGINPGTHPLAAV